MSEEFPLTRKIKAHGEEVSALTIRELQPADARMVGALPYYIAGDESVRIDPAAAAKHIVKMTGIPMGSVDQLHPVDFNALCWRAAGFFLNSGSEPSTSSDASSTTSPTSGD
ncbi:phage tail assembly protein [Bordetella bronchiseptica]|uniref:phage tail assembly protein n=1 Tax=Bordetella bronchiseptica TaxID=518 RepID=UPI0004615BC5|nr:phage tail assembly protein [Bordetella bronchiseptica]KDD50170.1 Mu-like prophage FluMu protein gp41 [Bordetella bronchiseptica MBORD901]